MGFALLFLSVAITIPGRHGQRLLNAALLGCGAGALAFIGLRAAVSSHPPYAWIPGATAVVAFVLFALFGLIAVRWATAIVVALLFGAAGSLAASAMHVFWLPVAALLGGFGLLVGMVNYAQVTVLVPPIFCALFFALGAAIAWAPHWRGAILWQLNDVDWVLGFSAIVAVVLLALSLEREYRKKLRLAARTKRMEDDALKKGIEAKKAAFERAHQDGLRRLDS